MLIIKHNFSSINKLCSGYVAEDKKDDDDVVDTMFGVSGIPDLTDFIGDDIIDEEDPNFEDLFDLDRETEQTLRSLIENKESMDKLKTLMVDDLDNTIQISKDTQPEVKVKSVAEEPSPEPEPSAEPVIEPEAEAEPSPEPDAEL